MSSLKQKKAKIKVFQLIFQACSDCCNLFEAYVVFFSPSCFSCWDRCPIEAVAFWVFFDNRCSRAAVFSRGTAPCLSALLLWFALVFLFSACVMVWCVALMWMQRASVSALLSNIRLFSNPAAGAVIEEMKTSLLWRIRVAASRAWFTKELCGFCGS